MLSSYPNIYNTCLVLLRRKGFILRYERATDSCFAEQNGFQFRADNPVVRRAA